MTRDFDAGLTELRADVARLTPLVATAAARFCDRTCRHWSHDMDGAYCTHPKSFEIAPGFGASTNRMSIEGHCMGKYDDPEKNTRALWEPSA